MSARASSARRVPRRMPANSICTEAAGVDRDRGRDLGFGVGAEEDLGHRARGVGDDDGQLALATTGPEKLAVVGLLPADATVTSLSRRAVQ